MHVSDALFLAAAGLLGGGVNAIAGGGSLIVFPAFVATGYATLAANVTNSLAQWPGYLGGVAGFALLLPTPLPRYRLPVVDGPARA